LAKRNFVFLFAPPSSALKTSSGPAAARHPHHLQPKGPLLNRLCPAPIRASPDFRFPPMMAHVLAMRPGLEHAAIVHRRGGFDELTPSGPGRSTLSNAGP
jgi:anthranilate phosphoribosyltransferase